MKSYKKLLLFVAALAAIVNPLNTPAEDIDIFTGVSAGAAERPNVLIVLDNTSNWARQNQKWPDGLTQGQAEVRSIERVLDVIGTDINIGVMEFVTNGDAGNTGGFIRFPVVEMNATNKAALKTQMQEIFNNINGNDEKRNSGTPYGNLMYDVYNYLAGLNVGPNSSALNPPSAKVNPGGYDTLYSKFKTPLSSDSSCAKNYVIFIGNPNSNGPSADTATNKTELASLGCSTTNIPLPNFTTTLITSDNNLGNTTNCYADVASCTAAIQGNFNNGEGDPTFTSVRCVSPVAPDATCADGTRRYSVLATDNAGNRNLGSLSSCVQNAGRCAEAIDAQFGDLCKGNGVTCSCTNQTSVGCAGGNAKYNYTIVRNKSFTDSSSLGFSSACYATAPVYSGADFSSQCTAFASYAPGSGCSYGEPTSTGASCGAGTAQYSIVGTSTVSTAVPSGTYDATKGVNWNLDDWARCLYQKGVPVANGINQIASVYTIDVYNAQQNNDHTSLLLSAAHQGGGKYFAATNEGALLNSLKQIFAEIQSVNSTFASASLPVNATNRAQNENQVFIGMFRPDPSSQPRWFGNLKRYQLVLEGDGVSVNLGDKNGEIAVNNQTGFISDCATSFWTTDSPVNPSDLSKGYFWTGVVTNPDAASDCVTVGESAAYSDLPDGPKVEKGAVAEVMRKGNEPPATDGAPTWSVNRTIYTTQSAFDLGLTPLSNFDGLSAAQKSWVSGVDNFLPNEHPSTDIDIRPSIHGDVVHSRPLPVTYGAGDGVVFYGANDGMFRAVDAETGKELWAIMPFEFAQTSFVDRLRENKPLIRYPTTDLTITPTPIPKGYGWDGSIGISQNLDNSKVWIYPTMRRGGQMVYAMDVTTKTQPSILWKHGCYNGSCSNGFENIGQTWSAPVVAPVAGYEDEKIAIFGGGYDLCEDADTPQPPCASPRGANVYVVDAGNGTLLNTFETERSVVSEVAVVDMNNDGKADYAYVGDTGGNLYRINMVSVSIVSNVATYTALPYSNWTINKIGVAGEGRKFMFQPALLALSREGKVYVALGSGDREHPLESNYPFSSVTNRFYVYLDDVTKTTTADLNALVDRTADPGCEASVITSSSVQPGYFMDLNQYGQGEQTVTSALILAGQVVFSTNRPIPPETGTCSTVLGEARGYWMNLLTGSGTIGVEQASCGGIRSSIFVGGGLPPSPVSGRVLINDKPVSVVIGAVDKSGGASTPISPSRVVPGVKPIRKRLYHKQKGVD